MWGMAGFRVNLVVELFVKANSIAAAQHDL
jgi:hypothetical protein